MSQEGVNLPQDVQEIHDHTSTITINTPVESMKTGNSNSRSNSGKSDENNNGSKPASPDVLGVGEEIKGEVKSAFVKDEDEGEVGGDGSSSGASLSKSKSSSDEVDHELKDVVAGSSEGGSGGSGNSKVKNISDVEHEMHIWTERERRKKMKNMYNTLQGLLPRLTDKADKATIVGEAVTYIKTLQGNLQRLEQMKMERIRAQAQQRAAANANAAGEPFTLSLAPAPVLAQAPPATREKVLAEMAQGWNAQRQAARAASHSHVPGAVPAPPPPPLQTWSAPNISVSITGIDAFLNLSMPRKQGAFTTVLFVLEKHHLDIVTATVASDNGTNLFSLHVRLNNGVASSSENLTPEERYKIAVTDMMVHLAN